MKALFRNLMLVFSICFALTATAGVNNPILNPVSILPLASFPAASSVPVGTTILASDANYTTWYSNGSNWGMVSHYATIFQTVLPMGLPPSGTVAANGVVTLGTALDNVYPSIYFYMPAGWYTGATAGMYYFSCTTTTSCTGYQNQYTSGVPTIPGSPIAVTTGAGAYTQTTVTYLTVLSYTLPANIMGSSGRITANVFTTNSSSANSKYIAPTQPFSLGQAAYSTTTGQGLIANGVVQNINSSRQICSAQTNATMGTYPTIATINTANSVNITPQLYITTSTDWIILQSYQLVLSV